LQLRYIIVGKLSGIDIKLEYSENPLSVHPDNAQYQPAYTYYLKRLMKCLSINATDRLFDYGSGKGAAMIFFARYPFCEIGGIELMRGLHETALKNIKKTKLNHLTSYNGNAVEYGGGGGGRTQ
jgi:cyclopropane fatty-acyl-phospholipid synthase-like methyltransferase